VHLGAYGLDFSPQTSLTELLNRIHESTAIARVRLSSIEPLELTEDIIKLVAETGNFCHHFHIPLQSGDDFILKGMHRPYTSWFFRDLINKINELIPDNTRMWISAKSPIRNNKDTMPENARARKH
jgi:threonylcarbamoyladenosine tRNA methylthiotransferase MtaB